MTLQEELNELIVAKQNIESPEIQKYLIKPMIDKFHNLKAAYQCDSLREMATLKGKSSVYKEFLNLLKEVDQEIKSKKLQIELESQAD